MKDKHLSEEQIENLINGTIVVVGLICIALMLIFVPH